MNFLTVSLSHIKKKNWGYRYTLIAPSNKLCLLRWEAHAPGDYWWNSVGWPTFLLELLGLDKILDCWGGTGLSPLRARSLPLGSVSRLALPVLVITFKSFLWTSAVISVDCANGWGKSETHTVNRGDFGQIFIIFINIFIMIKLNSRFHMGISKYHVRATHTMYTQL